MRDHDLRQLLNDEIHGRPGLPVSAPARITHLAFTFSGGDDDPLHAIIRLCDSCGVLPPPLGAAHFATRLAGGLFKYERHGEFYRISFTQEGEDLVQEAISALPFGWIDDLPGRRLVGIHTHILSQNAAPPDAMMLKTYFAQQDIAISLISQSGAMVWTDFRIADDGYTHFLIHDFGLGPERLGRLTRRLHEIETYRMMALLAFPIAAVVSREVKQAEARLTATTKAMADQAAGSDSALLAELMALARDVEALSNQSSFRFAAARAYAGLVEKRVRELDEKRVQNYQRLGVFLDRRFTPAMATCEAAARRINDLAVRIERASNLLRTRVDIALEAQNQQLLRSMNRRAHQQLLLQETVEGLSVVAISYYLVSLLAKFLDGMLAFIGRPQWIVPDWVLVPLVLVGVGFAVRRLRQQLASSGRDV